MTGPHVRLSQFHINLLYDLSYEDTWKEHGGLAGHIEHSTRREYNLARLQKDYDMINYAATHQSEFPVLVQYSKDIGELYRKFGLVNAVMDPEFDYFLFTGFSRSGGTYQQNEYARMKAFDIKKEHISFNHDFFPSNQTRAVFDYKQMLDDLHIYFAALITMSRFYHRKSFFFRTILGALYLPYICQFLALCPKVKFYWRHIIRDLHGAYRSLDRMFSGEFPQKANLEIYHSVCEFDTDFGNVAMFWFMANTTILPTMRGLPFWDLKIDTTQPESRIKMDIKKCIDQYIDKNKHVKGYEHGLPVIQKFGRDVEEKCSLDGKILAVDKEYKPDQFNYKPVPEIDDKHSSTYEFLLEQLTVLYQAFGIDFDGKLERI
ncbi:MAG: hypothetical protein C0403_19510 [Desulfobacterium sp.]|nr:hypothetical protein [Desulfobacterium sp.]